MLSRFWIHFKHPPQFSVFGLGCGVTAYDEHDAFGILQETVFAGTPMPEIASVVKDIDVNELDPGRIRPNMGNVALRGVWFPLGYEASYWP